MNPDSTSPEKTELSALGRALLDTGSSKSSKTWEPPTAEELHAILPQYEIIKMLGRGGMGAVYMGRQISLDRPVAIKILSAALGEADVGFTERFKNEAKAMAKLNHPGIVSVHDFGEAPGGLLYIVMEYVDGTDVARMIAANGRLHTEHAMAITAHVCDALAYAHERGIIHRDIKPANIMVGYDGAVKVADFGLAKVDGPLGNTHGLTQTGVAMGTMHFMAPEMLILGSAVDQRADIYAVGVMLFQMLTGKLPHGMFEMPSMQVKGLDPRYDGIIARSLREDREMRYQSAGELRRDLDAIVTQPVVKADPEATKSSQPVLPTRVRPKRPGGKPEMLGSARVPGATLPMKRRGRFRLGITTLVLALLAGLAWLIWPESKPEDTAGDNIPDLSTSESTKKPETGTSTAAVVTGPSPAHPTGAPSVVALATKDQPFVNSLGMKFVPVPGTDVLFCIHETRYRDFAAYAAETPGLHNAWKDQSCDGFTPTDRPEDHPVMRVSWEEAQGFCAWLSRKEGKTYRLPTDREWSFCVGIGDQETWRADTTPASVFKNQTDFPWGSQWPPPPGSGNFSDESRKAKALIPVAEYLDSYDDGFPTTAPVMSFKPNSLGLYDLEGNVLEWCADMYGNGKNERVLRGGSWIYGGNRGKLLSSFRSRFVPEAHVRDFGFRLVLEESGVASETAQKDSQAITLQTTSSTEPAVATKEQPFVNTIGMTFVPVPGSNVLFCIHETRYRDYAAFADETLDLRASWRNQAVDGFAPTERPEDHPVAAVSWEEVLAFCVWLSEKEGKTYRLPTNDEWNIAVGGGRVADSTESPTARTASEVESAFPWEGHWPLPNGVANYADTTLNAQFPSRGFIEGYSDGFPTTAPVMSFKPNSLGIYDLAGNIQEWMGDWPNAGQENNRIHRGGSWASSELGKLSASHRDRNQAFSRAPDRGFRVVLELDDNTASPPSASDTSGPLGDPPNRAKRVIDLLPLVDLPRDASHGEWSTTPDGIGLAKTPSSGPRIQFPHPIATEEYDYEVEISYVHTDMEHRLGFPVPGRRIQWAMNVFADRTMPTCFFVDLDGVPAARAKEAVARLPRLESGSRHRITIKVRRGELAAHFDGREVVRWKGDAQRFNVSSRKVRDPQFPDLFFYSGGVHIHKATIIEFEPQTASQPPSSAASATKDNPFVNTLGMKFLPVPGTTVLFCIHETRYRDYAAYA